MALTTYAGLKASVASWLNRTDLTTQIVDFIALAEADIGRDVNVRAMETLTTGTLTGETLAHPTRFSEARRLTLAGKNYSFKIPSDYTDAVARSSTDTIYTIIGSDFYILNGKSGDAYALTYSAAFASLSADADTNWLLTNAPDVYLFGALRYGAIFMNDSEALTRYLAMYLAAVKNVNGTEQAAKYSGSRLVMRPG